MPRYPLELLAPAKNLEYGIEAIKHGADALYIGGPAFGARNAAGNSVAEIGQLAEYAHRFHARVYVALNTLLFDHELEAARQLAWQLYEAGVDALIVQDMGLLELDLPPLALHASTQTDNRTPEKVHFLAQAGFSQVVLARELTLEQIAAIASETEVTLEFFVHGALCVSYSGQCYLSHAQTGRSANRGECAQLCRLPYSLEDAAGQVLLPKQHLLSLKDMNQRANLEELVAAGVTSFKIEGRLKDLAYVKNVTASYRQALDRLLETHPQWARATHGQCSYAFEPQLQKTFNRGATDYFLHGRQAEITSWQSPKFIGEALGSVASLTRQSLTLVGDAQIANGDGLCFFDRRQQLQGLRINRADGAILFPAAMPPELENGMQLFRNGDRLFEKQLEKPSAVRRIAIDLLFTQTEQGFALRVSDEHGFSASASVVLDKQPARQPSETFDAIRAALCKLGNTDFCARQIQLDLTQAWFIPASTLNALRRDAVGALEQARRLGYARAARAVPHTPVPRFPAVALDYRGNVSNHLARAFYLKHGVEQIDDAYECNRETALVPLMITKHCLRYSLGQCPREGKTTLKGPLTLVGDHQQRYRLRFDCRRCEMQLLGQLKPRVRGAHGD